MVQIFTERRKPYSGKKFCNFISYLKVLNVNLNQRTGITMSKA